MIPDSVWGRFVGLIVIFSLAQMLYVGAVNPEVLRRRTRLKKGTEGWDWTWLAAFALLFVAIPGVANSDVQATPLPSWGLPIGGLLFVVGGGVFLRAMGENPFFEKTVRIQTEQGHRVIDTGPYRFVRHPGYVGLIGWILSYPFLLDSSRSLVPAVATIIAVVVRTALEDRTLRAKLPGYADYAKRVRSRLLPGVW